MRAIEPAAFTYVRLFIHHAKQSKCEAALDPQRQQLRRRRRRRLVLRVQVLNKSRDQCDQIAKHIFSIFGPF